MPGILNILQNTPLWVYAVFVLLMWFGVQGLRPRTLPLWRLLITPAIFIIWGIASLAVRSISSPLVVADWAATLAAGAVIAWTMSRLDNVEIDRGRGAVSLPASALPLIRNVLILSAKYGLGVAAAMMPARRSELALWDIAVSGASAGYFLGWLARLALAYRRGSEPGLAEQVP
jgi:hypothetical protein